MVSGLQDEERDQHDDGGDYTIHGTVKYITSTARPRYQATHSHIVGLVWGEAGASRKFGFISAMQRENGGVNRLEWRPSDQKQL